MEIGEIVIERQDGAQFCGILFYRYDQGDHYVPWTADVGNPQKVVLKLFPPDVPEDASVVQEHYKAMANAIVGIVMRH